MTNSQLIKLIKEILNEDATSAPPPANTPAVPGRVQGSINIKLFQKLDPNINPSILSTTIGKVKNGSGLNVNDNKILAGLMTSLIKTSDDTLLSQIFANLKQIQAK
jgi:hypothetical protein